MNAIRPLVALALALSSIPARASPAGPHEVELTWMSIANWYFKLGSLRIVMDGYITRVPTDVFVPSPLFPADRFTTTNRPWPVDVAAVERVHDALSAGGQLDYLLAGHSHFDHTYDTATWSALTGAPIIGGLSTCFQAQAMGLPAGRCLRVDGGERIDLGSGVTIRVVRWNHSGNASNPYQHFARELSAPPVPDPVTGGWHAGVAEDFPNGGGGRAFLFTIDNPGGPVSFFVNNSASAFDLDKPIVVDGVNYGAPLANLAAALKDAGLSGVDVWIGTGGAPVAQLVVPLLHPKVYLPNHWDGLFAPFEGGMPFPFVDAALSAYLASQGVALMPELQYFDTFRVDSSGVTRTPNHDVKQKLGYPDVQPFPAATQAVTRAATATVAPDDCND